MTGLTYEVTEKGDLRVFFAGTHQERSDQQSGLLAERSDMDAEAADPGLFGTDDNMYDVFERLLCNSELAWVNPEYTGSLTDAPMLGFFGPDTAVTPDMEAAVEAHKVRLVGSWDDNVWYNPVVSCWAFMGYETTSPQDVLAERGEVFFTKAR